MQRICLLTLEFIVQTLLLLFAFCTHRFAIILNQVQQRASHGKCGGQCGQISTTKRNTRIKLDKTKHLPIQLWILNKTVLYLTYREILRFCQICGNYFLNVWTFSKWHSYHLKEIVSVENRIVISLRWKLSRISLH